MKAKNLVMSLTEETALEIYRACRGKVSIEAEVELHEALENQSVDLLMIAEQRYSEVETVGRLEN